MSELNVLYEMKQLICYLLKKRRIVPIDNSGEFKANCNATSNEEDEAVLVERIGVSEEEYEKLEKELINWDSDIENAEEDLKEKEIKSKEYANYNCDQAEEFVARNWLAEEEEYVNAAFEGGEKALINDE